MTTRESLSPRLRTNDRVPELVAFAGVIGFPSSADFLGVFTDVGGCTFDGVGTLKLDTSVARAGGGGSTDFGDSAAGAAVMGPTCRGACAGAGCAMISLPRTSITSRSGSRKVKLVTLLTFPTSNTMRTVELAY